MRRKILVVGPSWVGDMVMAQALYKLLAKRAAEADCYRKLAETVYGVKISSDTYVRDFITESDDIRTGVDTFVKGIRLSQPRFYEDGVAEVDGEVTVSKLITTLKTMAPTARATPSSSPRIRPVRMMARTLMAGPE